MRCFKEPTKKPVIASPRLPDDTRLGDSVNDPKVAFVIGHNEKSQGALNYLGESEYVFNTRIAQKVQRKLIDANIGSVIIFRPTNTGYTGQCRSVAKKAKDLGVYYAICMHFNSAGQGAKGCEVLVTKKANLKALKIADEFTDRLNMNLGIRERGDDGIKYVGKGHNGYGMLDALESEDVDSILIEPCFANYRTPESRSIFEYEDRYADIIAGSISNVLGVA